MDPKLMTEKLAALRSKTDRELVTFVENRLDDASRFARLEDPDSHAQVEQIRLEVSGLLPLIDGLNPAQRRSFEARLHRIAGPVNSARVMSMCG